MTWDNGDRWVASFITYQHFQTVIQRHKRTGECLSGAYIWTSDMILIDTTTRQRIEEVIQDIIDTNYFQNIFTHIPKEEDELNS